jgi:very-short-patch-repair endonuclease
MPYTRSSPSGYQQAHKLRQAQTPAEIRLWAFLRRRQMQGARFRRQHALGPYVVDFCAPGRKLVIEIDGAQHSEQAEYDAERTDYLNSRGYRVLRFWNTEIMNDIERVLNTICQALEQE